MRVHPLLDGRDVGERSALTYLDALEDRLAQLNGVGGRDYRIASGGGRMVTTMDRYGANWGVVERGWKAHVLGIGRHFASARQAVETYYREDPASTDQYLDSFVIESGGEPVGTIQDGDAVVFFNFRGDRAIEISRAFEEEDFREFDRVRVPDVFYAGMMQYDGDAQIPKQFLVEPPAIDCHRVAVSVRRGRHVVRDLGDPEVRARHVLLEREQLRLHRRAPGEVRRDPVRQGEVRRAAVDEGGGDHRRGDRGRPVGALPVHPAELPQRRHGGPHRRSQRHPDRGRSRGPRPPAPAAGRPRRAAACWW